MPPPRKLEPKNKRYLPPASSCLTFRCGHAATEENTIYRKRSGKKYAKRAGDNRKVQRCCRLCYNARHAIWLKRKRKFTSSQPKDETYDPAQLPSIESCS